MLTTLILAASLTGQSCNIRGTYQQQAVTRGYTATLYQQPTYAATYNAQVYTNYIPVLYQDYASIVGEATRNQDRRIEALKAQADLALRLDKINETLARLSIAPAPSAVPLAAPDVPGKPLPVPAKPSPQSPEQPSLPPTPKVNPDNGDVPPPPPTPNPGPTGALGGFSAETTAVLTGKCQRCHSVAFAPKQGGSVVLFAEDGSVRNNFTGSELLKLVRAVETGRMPKKSLPLTAEERAFIRGDVMASKAVESFLAAAE